MVKMDKSRSRILEISMSRSRNLKCEKVSVSHKKKRRLSCRLAKSRFYNSPPLAWGYRLTSLQKIELKNVVTLLNFACCWVSTS